MEVMKMKKIFLSILLFVIVFTTMNNSVITAVETTEANSHDIIGTLFVNGIEITDGAPVLGRDDMVALPFRTILEALGSTVIWESSTRNVYFDFNGVVYVGENTFRTNYTDLMSVLFSNVQFINNLDVIHLSIMSGAFFRFIDGSAYLSQLTGRHLFTALGCEVIIDAEQGIVRIYHNPTPASSSSTTVAEVMNVNMSDTGALIINDIEITDGDPVIKQDDQLLFPLRTVLEALGSGVIWESSTGNYYFDFDGVVYVLRHFGSNVPETKTIFIGNVQYINTIYHDRLIQLDRWSSAGFSHFINGRTYLTQQTGQHLLEAFGFEINIDIEQRVLRIYDN